MGSSESADFFLSYRQQRAFGLRVNSLKITPETLAKQSGFHLKSIPFCPSGFYYEETDKPGKHPYHQAGLYYIQEPSAMFVAEQIGARPGEKVLDLCAAPGGKSAQIAAAMNNEGLLVANEVYPKRARALSENIERMGITNTLVTNETPERLADYFPGYFNRILVDAPCSGEGMFRKDPQAVHYWSTAHVRKCAALQSKILDYAYRMLAAGGILVYSTCTFSPEENEQMIDGLLAKYPDLELLPVEKKNGIENGRPEWTESQNSLIGRTARLWPHRLAGEGHFAAKLQKYETVQTVQKGRTAKSAKETLLKDYRLFESEALAEKLNGIFFFAGKQLFLLPGGCPDLDGLNVIRAGLHLGEQKKKRFEPNHALALALPAQAFRSTIAMTSKNGDWEAYLRGETLPAPAGFKGWAAVLIDGFPLGWVKAAGGLLKNYYPKGLRQRALNHENR